MNKKTKDKKDKFGIKRVWLSLVDEKTGEEILCDCTNYTLNIDIVGKMYSGLMEDRLDELMYQKVGRWYE